MAMLVNHISNAHNAAAAKVLLLLTAYAYLPWSVEMEWG
jgi:hypothetical protein